MEKYDLRYEKNEAALLEAFLDLLLEENFADIKVSQICQRAKINRSTFYLHYDNKEALLEEMSSDVLNEFSVLVADSLNARGNELEHKIFEAFKYMAKYRRVLQSFNRELPGKGNFRNFFEPLIWVVRHARFRRFVNFNRF